jgi:alanyl-tRNA synthetase
VDHKEIRQKFLDYFVAQGHTVVPSSSLVPSGDESVLLTTAGMQQFKPYFLGEGDAPANFGNTRLTSIQKCFRTSDIDEVGDEHHHTFFEMLGNFSVGNYFKEQAIPLAWNFLTQELKLDPKQMFVTVFSGDSDISKDNEAQQIWKRTAPGIEIREYGKEDNFWGPTGDTGPCGPCSEIIYTLLSGLEVELWNLVFMEYFMDEKGRYTKLKQKNIDTGMGLERLALILQGKGTVFETDLFAPIIVEIEKIAAVGGKSRLRRGSSTAKGVSGGDPQSLRIIADHIRGAVFLIADGVQPLNIGRGYVLRRILRRAILHGRLLDIGGYFLLEPTRKVIGLYSEIYPELTEKDKEIMSTIEEEEEKFGKALNRGLRQLERMGKEIDAFVLYDTYGFPLELTEEIARSRGLKVNKKEFEKKLGQQRERARRAQQSRAAVGEIIAPQHTAAHLLNAALKQVLGPQVRQAGQHLSADKFRHDFTFGRKPTKEELRKVEALVNEKIRENLPVAKVETTYERAREMGAEAVFTEKYREADQLTMYCVGCDPKTAYSKELCAGPHVKETAELGHFEIIKEESAGAGVRRIYARAVK